MIPYLTFTEPNEEGQTQYFILQKVHPHILAEISEQLSSGLFQSAPINEYNLFINFKGTLRGLMIPAYRKIDEEINSVLHSMADWFYNNRILINEKKYKKWKINH